MLDVWVLDRVADGANHDHGVDHGRKAAGLEILGMVPVVEAHERAAVHGHARAQA